MFAGRIHTTNIELNPDEEILYRLPPVSAGPVEVQVVVPGGPRPGPKGQTQVDPDTAPTDLELELKHPGQADQSFPGGLIITESKFADDLWRLRVKRKKVIPVDPATPIDPLHKYKITVTYMSQLPVLDK